jgi:hypothetical protein
MSILVTLGNTRLLTFNNVCFATQVVYPEEIEALLVFDTPESIADGLEGKRNESVRQIFPEIQIRSQLVQETTLQTIIPLTLAQLLGEFDISEIIIDLTNGPKAATGVLYAVATISKIDRIQSLHVKDREDLSKPLSELSREAWEYVSLEPLKEISAVAQRCYLDLLYYQDQIDEVSKAIEEQNSDFAQQANRLLNQALEDYFRGQADTAKYNRAVATLGIICEDIAKRLYLYCVQSKKTHVQASSFNDYNNQVKSILEQLRSRKADWEAEGYFGQQMVHILPFDQLLETARVLRNFVAHPTAYKCREHETRLMLNLTLTMLDRLPSTDILSRIE